MSEVQLKDRNKNPWYILMTLHGEQEGEEIDWELAERNRKLWNAWVFQGMDHRTRVRLAEAAKFAAPETSWSDAAAREVHTCFEREWFARNGETAALPDLPSRAKGMDLGGTAFPKPLVLKRTILKAARFGYSTFTQGVYSSSAFFWYGANFTGATFKKTADFSGAKFEESVDFPMTEFQQSAVFHEADFAGRGDFSEAKFGQTTSFHRVIFRQDADFSEVNFVEKVDFFRADFRGRADFRDVEFNGLVDFRGRANERYEEVRQAAYFSDTVFSGAHFHKRADFFRRRFGPHDKPAEELTFANAIFDAPVSFEQAEFPHLMPVLTNTTLPASTKVTVDDSDDRWPGLPPNPLEMLDIRLRLRKSRSYSEQDPETVKASAASLRHAMARQMLPEEEHFFFRREMWGAQRTGPWLARPIIWLYGVISEYGYSIGRPTVLLIELWLAGWYVFAQSDQFGIAKSAFMSFATMFKFFGLQGTHLAEETKHLSEPMQVWAGTQTVLAFILLFFLGLGLRTRFRLR